MTAGGVAVVRPSQSVIAMEMDGKAVSLAGGGELALLRRTLTLCM